MSNRHGESHRTATPSEEKHGVTRLLQIDNESQKNSFHVCCVPKSGDVSLLPQKYKALQRNFGCLLAAPFKILRKHEVFL